MNAKLGFVLGMTALLALGGGGVRGYSHINGGPRGGLVSGGTGTRGGIVTGDEGTRTLALVSKGGGAGNGLTGGVEKGLFSGDRVGHGRSGNGAGNGLISKGFEKGLATGGVEKGFADGGDGTGI